MICEILPDIKYQTLIASIGVLDTANALDKQFRTQLDTNYKYCTGVAMSFTAENASINPCVELMTTDGERVFNPISVQAWKVGTDMCGKNFFWSTLFRAQGNSVILRYTGDIEYTAATKIHVVFRLSNEIPANHKKYDFQQELITIADTADTKQGVEFQLDTRAKKLLGYAVKSNPTAGNNQVSVGLAKQDGSILVDELYYTHLYYGDKANVEGCKFFPVEYEAGKRLKLNATRHYGTSGALTIYVGLLLEREL